MRKLFISIFMASSVLCWADDVRVSSPDGNLVVTVSDAGGRLYYNATLSGKQLLEPSALGLKTSIGDLTKDLSIYDVQSSKVDRQYTMRGTKASSNTYNANTMLIKVRNKDGVKFRMQFQVSNNDIAFRYMMTRQTINRREYKRVRILSELSSFNFADGTTTFISPQIGPETGWEQTKPSYEEVYSNDAPMNKPSQYGHGYIFPALFHLPNGWALVSETGVNGGYCGSHLSDYQVYSRSDTALHEQDQRSAVGSYRYPL